MFPVEGERRELARRRSTASRGKRRCGGGDWRLAGKEPKAQGFCRQYQYLSQHEGGDVLDSLAGEEADAYGCSGRALRGLGAAGADALSLTLGGAEAGRSRIPDNFSWSSLERGDIGVERGRGEGPGLRRLGDPGGGDDFPPFAGPLGKSLGGEAGDGT